MRIKNRQRTKAKNEALARSFLITSVYALLGFVWIIGSEIILSLTHNESSAVFIISIFKGLAFVAVTSLVIFVLVSRGFKKIMLESDSRARSEAALNEAQRFASIGSFEYDSKSKKMTASQEALRILGTEDCASYSDLAHCFDRVHPLDRPRVEEEVLFALESRQNASLFFRFITERAGTIRNVHVRLILRNTEDAPYYKIFGTIQDITDRIQAENAAKDNETIYKTFINSSADLIYLKDNNLRYLAVNTNMQLFYGLREEQLIGKTTSEAMSYSEGADWEALDRRVLEEGEPVYVEDVSFGRTFETIIFPVELADQKRGVGGISRDISQRKQAEAAVEQERDRAQTYLDNAAIINIALDVNGFVTLINKAGCDKLGLQKAEILGKDWIEHFVPSCERDSVRQVLRRIYDGSFPQEQVNENGMINAYGKERRIEWRNTILRDGEGAPCGIFAAGVDITDLLQAIQALRESERSKSVLLSNLPGMAYRCACDHNWSMKFVSSGCCELTGYAPEDLIDNNKIAFNDLILPEYREPIWEESNSHLFVRESNRYEYEILTATGERKWVLDINQGVYGESGEIEALEGIIVDITESKRQFLQIQYLSDHDQLTGLYNRSYFESERNRINREKRSPVALLYADINGLKLINDAFGSGAGDRIIQKTAELLRSSVRSGDILARIGGDEFALLLSGTDSKAALNRIQEIQGVFNAYNETLADRALVINVSIGWSEKDTPDADISQLEKEAEANLARRKLFDQKSHHNAVLSSIMTTLFERSYETEEHAERIGSLCAIIGERIGLSHGEIDKLRLFAILHDIGKIGVSDQILNKPGPLDDEELAQMRKHPEIGYRIAMSSPELAPIAELILSHHERWDGTGYPNRISGEKIPLLSRILALVDAYDAMTNDRVYRKALPREEVILEVKRNSGTQFDPELCEIFLQTLSES